MTTHYKISIFEENGVMHFHGSEDWCEYRKQRGQEPGKVVECNADTVERWAMHLSHQERVQRELRESMERGVEYTFPEWP